MKKYITFICLVLLLSGCKKFVSIGPPKNQLVQESVFETDGEAIAALTNIYGQMMRNNISYLLPFYTGIAGDELTNYSTSAINVQLYENVPIAADAASNSLWNNGYSYIYLANAVWEGCEKSTHMNLAVKKQLMAEAKFIRAFWYFYLVNLYGDVPLLLSTDYDNNSKASRTAMAEVYTQIILDLQYAADNLNVGYVNASAVGTTTERIRPNQFAAKALLARVYLYNKDWSKAEENATAVISNLATYDMVALTGAFLKNNKEAIWQLAKPDNAGNLATQEGQFFILTTKPTVSSSNNCSAISPQQYAAFALNDLRRTAWIGSYVDNSVVPNVTYYYTNKYKERNNTGFVEYTTPLRLSEQYLIRAEARTELNNLSGARDDLNKVRTRTGTGNTPAVTQDDLRVAILKERQLELFTEWGHRWLDMKRTGNIDAVMQLVSPAKGNPTWNSDKQLFPIPQKDIEANRNLKQNPSYN